MVPTRFFFLPIAALICYCECLAQPSFLYPKNVEPKITSSQMDSGLRLVRKEWLSATINTVVFEINSGTNQILMVVRQRASGIDRIFYHLHDSGFQTTIEQPIRKGDDVLFRIEKKGNFVDGFRFTADGELKPYPVEWLTRIKAEEKILKDPDPGGK